MIVVVSRGIRWASTVGIVLALVLAASGCSDDDDDEAGTTTSTAAPTTTSSPASTTSTSTTAPPSTTATTERLTFPSAPADYTAELVRAWDVGNRARAELFAGTAAVDALFSYADPGGPRWDLLWCDG